MRNRSSNGDFAQNALVVVERAIGEQLSTQPIIAVELGDRFLPGVVHTSIGSAHDQARRAGVNTKDLTVSSQDLWLTAT
jgi:hypothetical protein